MPVRREDPRRRDAVIPYSTPKVKEEDADSDFFGFFAMALGVITVLFKNRVWGWVSFIFAVVSVLQTKGSEKEYRQGAGAISFSAMTLVMVYVQFYTLKLQEINKVAPHPSV